MSFETERTSIPTWLIFVLATIFIALGFSIYYYYLNSDATKMIGLAGGIVSGLIVYLLTFISSIRPLQNLDRFERMGIRAVLNSRHDRDYYASILSGAVKDVYVMGASCTRFVDDFLDLQNENHALIDALHRSSRLRVRLLIPDDAHMSENAKARLPDMETKLAAVIGKFDGRIEMRRFAGVAQHSFVVCDDNLIAGPIFHGDQSKYAPAVHVSMRTRYAQKYDEYFDNTWDGCAR